MAGLLALWATGAQAATPARQVEDAITLLRRGDSRGAALAARRGLAAAPREPLLHNLAAAILFSTGDVEGAARLWSVVREEQPGDGLAVYGLGLTALARRGGPEARRLFEQASRTGDRGACLLALRYAEMLEGARDVDSVLGLPTSLAAGAHGLQGVALLRRGEAARAMPELTAALAAMPGDPYAEPGGPLMTFRPEEPLAFGGRPLSRGIFAGVVSAARGPAVSGTVMLSAGEGGADTGYVVFRVDAGLSSIINSPPYRMAWDTASVPNGLHHVEVIVYDRQGQEMRRTMRDVRTANERAPEPPPVRDMSTARALDALWSALALLPSRASVCAAAWQAARQIGDTAGGERLGLALAALEPGHPGLREALVGAAVGGPALWRGVPNEPVVALTFDDGPKPGITDQLLAVLAREGIAATFFVIGRHTTEYPDLTRRMAEAGMQIENHSYTHANLTILPPEGVERELLRTRASVMAASGKAMRYFRPPGGNINGLVAQRAAHWGMTPVMWSVNGEAIEKVGADRLASFIVKRAMPGAIILLHNGRSTTVQALPRIIQGLRRRGFGFVTIDQLAGRLPAPAQAAPAPAQRTRRADGSAPRRPGRKARAAESGRGRHRATQESRPKT